MAFRETSRENPGTGAVADHSRIAASANYKLISQIAPRPRVENRLLACEYWEGQYHNLSKSSLDQPKEELLVRELRVSDRRNDFKIKFQQVNDLSNGRSEPRFYTSVGDVTAITDSYYDQVSELKVPTKIVIHGSVGVILFHAATGASEKVVTLSGEGKQITASSASKKDPANVEITKAEIFYLMSLELEKAIREKVHDKINEKYDLSGIAQGDHSIIHFPESDQTFLIIGTGPKTYNAYTVESVRSATSNEKRHYHIQ